MSPKFYLILKTYKPSGNIRPAMKPAVKIRDAVLESEYCNRGGRTIKPKTKLNMNIKIDICSNRASGEIAGTIGAGVSRVRHWEGGLSNGGKA